MKFDLVFVTYNSQKWIKGCFDSIHKSNYNLKDLNIYIVDNNSKDNTIEELEFIKHTIGKDFESFNIIKSDKNLGFGKGNNNGFKKGDSDIVVFLNIDTEVFSDTFLALKNEILGSAEEVGLWELRQFPYEHPKFYNILTGYTTWSSGAAFAIRRYLYNELGGFDSKIFMYAEDVDLSWRLRAKGYQLKYCPKATIKHYSYEEANQIKPNQYVNSIINNLLLRYRFGDIKTILKGHVMLLGLMRHKGPFEHSRKLLLKHYLKHFYKIPHFLNWKIKKANKTHSFSPKFLGWDYEIIREGAFYKNEFPKHEVLVSIIVRTCNRPSILRETLISIRNQTYKNIEIVVVEDGEETAREMIENEFKDLNIKYKATIDKVGRSKAGNIAMQMATGEYLNFLDDDDLFFADHVEVLVNNFENTSCEAVYTTAYETPIVVKEKEPYIYEEIYHNLVYKEPFNRAILFHHNYIPIQSIMFKKRLFIEHGGLDETLDALEDWDLWVRYSLYCDFKYVGKATSIYRVPYDIKISELRQKQLDEALIKVREKHITYLNNLNTDQLIAIVKGMRC